MRRPVSEQREVLTVGQLDPAEGLVGDNWSTRGSSMTEDGKAHPEMQLNIMNACSTALVAPDSDRWALAGDQLYVDLDFIPVDPHVEWRQRSVESDERGYLSREQSRLRSLQVLVREGPLQPPEMAASGYR